MGLVVLPTVITYSRVLARLAIGLDKRPDLVANLSRRESVAGRSHEAQERVTLVEGSANVIREAFKKCLSERSGNTATGLDSAGKPEGRRVGIYLCANICLKLFFHCKKLRSAEQIFGNIYQQSPPLACFPASQRVTFLFYLGRYLFANNHFYRALLALQAAYDQCHERCVKQRRTILIYLIPANIIMGRFPTANLFLRPEAAGLQERFNPLCQALQRGDLAAFRSILDIENEEAQWFLQRRILLPLQNRCEVIVLRSLARRTFLLSGFTGDGSKKAPSVEIEDFLTLIRFLERKSQLMMPGAAKDQVYVDPDLADEVEPTPQEYTMEEAEAAISSLNNQNLLYGYPSHKFLRFIVRGAKTKSPVESGFPNVWRTLCSAANTEVPGWVKEEGSQGRRETLGTGAKGRGGMVVNLKGARPAGAAPA